MSMRATHDLKQAQHLANTAQTLAIIAMVLLAIAIAIKGGAVIASNLAAADSNWSQRVHNIGLVLIELMPAILFVEAINQLRQALTHFGRGEFFSSAVANHVAEAGSYAIYAMVAVMAITPNLLLWVNRQGGFDLRIEPEYIGMLAFAVFVSAIGKVLAAASEIKTENDAFV